MQHSCGDSLATSYVCKYSFCPCLQIWKSNPETRHDVNMEINCKANFSVSCAERIELRCAGVWPRRGEASLSDYTASRGALKRLLWIGLYCALPQAQKFLFYERLLENYYFVLPTTRAPPQISDNRPDMRQRALFVTSRAAWRWNKMLLARENVDSPLSAMVVATEHNAL